MRRKKKTREKNEKRNEIKRKETACPEQNKLLHDNR